MKRLLSLSRVSFFVLCTVTVALYLGWLAYQKHNTLAFGKENLDRFSVLENHFNDEARVSVSLFVRMPTEGSRGVQMRARFHCCLFRTTVLFWPTYFGKIVIVLDEETTATNNVFLKEVAKLSEQFPNYDIDIKYEPLPKDPNVLHFRGQLRPTSYNRQLWSSFFIDLYTEDTVVAWMDTDAAFLAPVTKSTIFNQGKLRVFAVARTNEFELVESWARTTRKVLGLPMVANFMVYFPAYVYRDTFTRCREYILKWFNTRNFEEAFQRFYHTGTGNLSPVCVVLTYAWHFEKDRYDWNLDIQHDLAVYNDRFTDAQHKIRHEHTNNGVFSAPQTAMHSNNKDYTNATHEVHPFTSIRNASICLAEKAAGRKTTEMCRERNMTLDMLDMLHLFNHDNEREKLIKGQTLCTGERKSECLKVLERYFGEVGQEMREKRLKCDWQDFQTVGEIAKTFHLPCPVNAP